MDYSTISAEELALTCFRTGDELAWTEFVRRFHPLIAGVVIRVARQWGEFSPQAVDDLIQETYLKLCADRHRILQNFKPAHSEAIYGYIKVFTANLAHDHFKLAHSRKRGGREHVASIGDEDSNRTRMPSTSSLAVMDRNLLLQEIDACLKSVSTGSSCDRDRRIFWLYYRAGLTANAIAALPSIGLSTKGVESTLLRLTKQVRRRLVPPRGQGPTRGITVEGIHRAESF